MAALFDCCMSVKTCPQAWQPYRLRDGVYEEIGESKLGVKVGHPLDSYLHAYKISCTCSAAAASLAHC